MKLEVRGYRLNKEGKQEFISGWDIVDRDNNNTKICHIEPDGFPSMLGTSINNLIYDLNRYIRRQNGEDYP